MDFIKSKVNTKRRQLEELEYAIKEERRKVKEN